MPPSVSPFAVLRNCIGLQFEATLDGMKNNQIDKIKARAWVAKAWLYNGGVAAITGRKNAFAVQLKEPYAFRSTLQQTTIFESVGDALAGSRKTDICILAAHVTAARFVAPHGIEIQRVGSTEWEFHNYATSKTAAREYAVNTLGVEID